MNNRKNSSLMTIHAVLLLIGFIEAIRESIVIITSNNVGFDSLLIDFSNSVNTYNLIVMDINLLTIIALVFSLVYLFKEYKKSAHVSYKAFLCIYLVIWILEVISSFVFVDVLIINKVLLILELIVLFILTFTKNLGKKNSKLLASALIILNVCIALVVLFAGLYKGYSPLPIVVNVLSGYLSYILLSSTTYIMVTGKYIDKDSRGAK